MAEEYKNAPEYETPKVATTEESSAAPVEVKDRGMFDFMKKKEEVKPQETPLESEFEHKTQISEPTFVTKHEEEEHKEHMNPVLEQIHHQKHEEEEHKEHKPSLLEQLHQKHEEDEENKPSLLHKLHRSNSSSSSSSDEDDKDGEKRKKKEKKKIFGGEEKTEDEKKGIMDKIKEKLPGHGKRPDGEEIKEPVTIPPPVEHPVVHSRTEEEKKGIMDQIKEKLPSHDKNDVPVVVGEPVTIPPPTEHPVIAPSVSSVEHPEEHPVEKKGILEKIKEKLPGYHAKTSGEEEKKVKESD